MNISVRITFKEEVSDHSGYCSGNECELTTRKYTKVVNLNIKDLTNDKYYYEKYADKISVNYSGSEYCDTSDDVDKIYGLGKHDFIITVLNVSIILNESQEN
jgi:hypothetical protein